MRARFLSRRENKQRKREREEKENNFAIISSPRPVSFSFIYTWKTEHHPADSRIVIKTGVQKVFFKVSRKEYSPRISFERKGTKRETNCRINKHAACPRAILDESNRERRPPTIPSREIIPTSLLWLQIIMGGGSGAYFTTQVRLIVLPLFTNRSGAPMMMVIGSETKFFLFFYFFQEQNIKVIRKQYVISISFFTFDYRYNFLQLWSRIFIYMYVYFSFNLYYYI